MTDIGHITVFQYTTPVLLMDKSSTVNSTLVTYASLGSYLTKAASVILTSHCTMWNGVHINLDTIKKSLEISQSAKLANFFRDNEKNMCMFHDHFFQASQMFCLRAKLVCPIQGKPGLAL